MWYQRDLLQQRKKHCHVTYPDVLPAPEDDGKIQERVPTHNSKEFLRNGIPSRESYTRKLSLICVYLFNLLCPQTTNIDRD